MRQAPLDAAGFDGWLPLIGSRYCDVLQQYWQPYSDGKTTMEKPSARSYGHSDRRFHQHEVLQIDGDVRDNVGLY